MLYEVYMRFLLDVLKPVVVKTTNLVYRHNLIMLYQSSGVHVLFAQVVVSK